MATLNSHTKEANRVAKLLGVSYTHASRLVKNPSKLNEKQRLILNTETGGYLSPLVAQFGYSVDEHNALALLHQLGIDNIYEVAVAMSRLATKGEE